MNIKILSMMTIVMMACESSREVTRGFGSETGNKVSGVVANNSNAMAKARVIARNYSTEDSVLVETDDQGKYELELVKGTWQLEVRTENLGASNFAKINDVDLEDLNFDLDSLVDVKGNNEKLKSQILILKGMARSVKVDDQGSWNFKELPKGAYITQLENDQEIMIRSGVENKLEDTGDTLVLENFEDSIGRNLLNPLLGGGWWYSWEPENGSSMTPNNLGNEYVNGLVDETPGEGLMSYKVNFNPVDGDSMGITLSIGGDWVENNPDRQWHRLKSIGSIQFLSKGAGEVFVEILVRTPPPLRGEFILTKPVTLSSNWETNILKLEEMTPNFDKGADFNDLEIKSISFKVKAVTSLWLDKIIIEGIKVSEFL